MILQEDDEMKKEDEQLESEVEDDKRALIETEV